MTKKSKTDTRNYIDIRDISPDGKKYKYTDEHTDPFTGLKRCYKWNNGLMQNSGEEPDQDGLEK